MTTPAPASPAATAIPPAGADKGIEPGKTGAEPPKEPTKPGAGEPPKPGEGAPAAGTEGPKKRKYKVNGRDVEIEEDKLDEYVQRGLGAQEKFTEAAKYRRQAQILTELLQRDPLALVSQAAKLQGKDARKMVEEWLWKNHIELETKSPEEREKILERRELERLREQEKTAKEKEREALFEKAKTVYSQHFERDIIKALETGGIPKTPRSVERMAQYLLQARQVGVRLGAADVLPLVKQDIEKEFKELVGSMQGESLANFLGEDVMKNVRDFEVARLKKGPGTPPANPNGGEPPKPRPHEKKKLTIDELKAELDKEFGE